MSALGYENTLRIASFVAVLVLMALWERARPRRALRAPKRQRWLGNLGLVVIDTLALRLLIPVAAIGTATYVEQHDVGLFHYLQYPDWVEIALAVVLLDFVIYLQHVMFHAVPVLWRLHRVHHADPDIDVTTGVRFHPIEILLSMCLKMGAVAALGAPVVAVLIFEVLLNATSLFNHSNVRLPDRVDRVLRLFLVTPDMHRVHHSTIVHETNSNFGFNIPWWDRLCGTYQAQPELGHTGMDIGLLQFRDRRAIHLAWLLALPFVGNAGNNPINRRATAEPERPSKND